jgi:hypothetical protein
MAPTGMPSRPAIPESLGVGHADSPAPNPHVSTGRVLEPVTAEPPPGTRTTARPPGPSKASALWSPLSPKTEGHQRARSGRAQRHRRTSLGRRYRSKPVTGAADAPGAAFGPRRQTCHLACLVCVTDGHRCSRTALVATDAALDGVASVTRAGAVCRRRNSRGDV